MNDCHNYVQNLTICKEKPKYIFHTPEGFEPLSSEPLISEPFTSEPFTSGIQVQSSN